MKSTNRKAKELIANQMRSLHNDERGSFAYFIVFFALAATLIFLFAIGIPFLQLFDSELYKAAQPLIDKQEANLAYIQDANVKAAMQANITAERNSIPHQIEVLSVFFQYGWVIILVVIAVVLFLLARRNVEAGVIG